MAAAESSVLPVRSQFSLFCGQFMLTMHPPTSQSLLLVCKFPVSCSKHETYASIPFTTILISISSWRYLPPLFRKETTKSLHTVDVTAYVIAEGPNKLILRRSTSLAFTSRSCLNLRLSYYGRLRSYQFCVGRLQLAGADRNISSIPPRLSHPILRPRPPPLWTCGSRRVPSSPASGSSHHCHPYCTLATEKVRGSKCNRYQQEHVSNDTKYINSSPPWITLFFC